MARDTLAVTSVGTDLKIEDPSGQLIDPDNDLEVTGVTKNTIIILSNGGVGTETATIVSVNDPYSRSGDIPVSLDAGKVGYYGRLLPTNWHQSGTATVHIDTADSTLTAYALDFNEIL